MRAGRDRLFWEFLFFFFLTVSFRPVPVLAAVGTFGTGRCVLSQMSFVFAWQRTSDALVVAALLYRN